MQHVHKGRFANIFQWQDRDPNLQISLTRISCLQAFRSSPCALNLREPFSLASHPTMISASAAAASSARPQNHSEGSRHSSISSTSATAATTSASTAIPSASFKTDYFGFALLQSADGPELVAESEQAVAAVLGKRVKPVRMELSISGSGLALVSSDGLRVAHIPLEELRSLSRHRDGKSGKPKVLTFMALSHYPGTERMG